MTGPPTSTRTPWTGELKQWAKALAWSLPFLVVAWIFVFPNLPAQLFRFSPAVGLAMFLVIGFLSRSSLWALIVWLLPWTAVTAASIAGAHGTLFAAFTVCAFAYSSLLMMYDWPYRWVNLATGWLWRALVEAGLPNATRTGASGEPGSSRRMSVGWPPSGTTGRAWLPPSALLVNAS
jgi:hypothetical protein